MPQVTQRLQEAPLSRLEQWLRQGRLENHMVLAYYPDPGAEPWVMDNLEKRFMPARERPDLTPVYSFNDDRVWKVQGVASRCSPASRSPRFTKTRTAGLEQSTRWPAIP